MQKSIKVRIDGTAPLLMHRFPFDEQKAEGKAKRKGEMFDPKVDAENALYKNDKGVYAPSEWIEAALRESGKTFKQGKGTYKSTMQSGVRVEPLEIPLLSEPHEIDRRPVVVQRMRVVRARPRFNKWALEFDLHFDDDAVAKNTIQQILEKAGTEKGLGDYRPKYGRFAITKFE